MTARGAFLLALTLVLAVPILAQDVLVSSRFSSQVLRYDGATGAFKGVFASGNGIANPNGIAYGPDGNLYAGNGDEGVVLRFNGQTGAFIDRFISTTEYAGARAIRFGPDGDLYVAAGSINKILRFNGTTGAFMGVAAETTSLRGPVGLDVASDGTIAVGGALSNGVYLFRNGQLLRECRDASLSANITGVLFGPAGTLYAATSNRNTILRVNTETCQMTPFASSGDLNIAIYMEFAPDGNLLVGSFTNDSVVKFDANSGAQLGVFVTSGSGGLDGTHDIAVMPVPPTAVIPAVEAGTTIWLTNPTDAPMLVRLGTQQLTIGPHATLTHQVTSGPRGALFVYGDAVVRARSIEAIALPQPVESWLDGLPAGSTIGVINTGSAATSVTIDDFTTTIEPLATLERAATASSVHVQCATCVVYSGSLTPQPARTRQWIGGVLTTPTVTPFSKRRAASTPVFRTSLTLANHNATIATVSVGSTSVTIPANSFRTVDIDASGSIELNSDVPVSAYARVNRLIVPSLALADGDSILTGVGDDLTGTTALGLRNTTDFATTVTVTAYSDTGVARGQKTYQLGAHQTLLVPRVLADLGAAPMANGSLRVSAGALAWALRFESGSPDPVFIRAAAR